MAKKLLELSIDDGFNGIKVVVNKHQFSIPSDVAKVDFSSVTSLSTGKEEDNLRYVAGTRSYFVGLSARRFLNSKKKKHEYKEVIDNLVNEKRTVSEEYVVGMESAISLAIYKYAALNDEFKMEELQDYEIRLAITIPHGVLKEYKSAVIANMAGNHRYTLTIGNIDYDFDYTIKEENILVYSQVIAAILGELLDDDGNPCLAATHPLQELPTIVIDGGWYTVGIANVREGLTIYDEEAESNYEFAMNNICELVCKNIKDKYNLDMLPREIEEYIINKDTTRRYKDKDGSIKTFDVEVEREIAAGIKVKEMLDYIDAKYDDLLYTKNILLTGGTGKAIFEMVRDNTEEVLGKDHILLTEGKFNGEKVDPMFAIAVGAYKALRGTFK